MHLFDWLQLAQFLSMAAAAALLWSVRQAFKSGQWLQLLETRLTALEKRMDKAGLEMSNFASTLQGMPERTRKDFVDKERFEDFVGECRSDRKALWQILNRRGMSR